MMAWFQKKRGMGYACGKHDHPVCSGDQVADFLGSMQHSHDMLCDYFLDQLVRKMERLIFQFPHAFSEVGILLTDGCARQWVQGLVKNTDS